MWISTMKTSLTLPFFQSNFFPWGIHLLKKKKKGCSLLFTKWAFLYLSFYKCLMQDKNNTIYFMIWKCLLKNCQGILRSTVQSTASVLHGFGDTHCDKVLYIYQTTAHMDCYNYLHQASLLEQRTSLLPLLASICRLLWMGCMWINAILI